MSGLLWGMAGAAIVDLAAVALAVLTLPRLLKRAMKKNLGAAMFGTTSTANLSRVKVTPATTMGSDDARS